MSLCHSTHTAFLVKSHSCLQQQKEGKSQVYKEKVKPLKEASLLLGNGEITELMCVERKEKNSINNQNNARQTRTEQVSVMVGT